MYGRCLFSRVVRFRSVNYSSNSSKKLLEFLAEMPKANSARIADAQRQRQNISKKSEKYGPSTVYLQVLGSGAEGVPNTLYLFTDQKRYLFNCGECTQRLAHEHKVKLSRLDHIFVTSKTWKNIGGLPGLSLTLQDVGVPNITLHGPKGLDDLYNATKRFVIMKDMNVTMAKCSPSDDFEDNVMTVKYVPLGPNEILTGKESPHKSKPETDKTKADKEYEEFLHDDTDYYQRNQPSKAKQMKEKERHKPTEKIDTMKTKTKKVLNVLQKTPQGSVAYICTLKKRLGTLDLAKCVEFGVKPGPMLGTLKSGHDVVLPDGTLVRSSDVKTPDDPGPVFIVLEVPELSYLKESDFAAHFHNDTNKPENVPVLIVHLTPPQVLHTPTYKSFMSLFGPNTRHLILNSQNSCLGSEAVHRTQQKLHLLDPDIFPLLRDVSIPAVWTATPPAPKTDSPIRLKGLEELKNKIAIAQFQNFINLEGSCKGDGHSSGEEMEANDLELLAGRTLSIFHLRPKIELERTAEPKLHIQEYIQEAMDADGFLPSLEQFRKLVEGLRFSNSNKREFPKVVFLGTGSCIPSKTRNTSAIVVQIDEHRSILLDCGEGTYGQLVRFYGAKKVNAFLRTLKGIYISHLHADHHIGLIGVIQAHQHAFELSEGPDHYEPLLLFAPGQIFPWLSMYDQHFEKIKNCFTLIPNQNLLYDSPSRSSISQGTFSCLGVQNIDTCLVQHCPNAFGLAIQVDSKYKLTYSGDTLPCEELVKIGDNSTLLIHEATMEDELVDEARTKMHSTTSQAIDIGRQMNARYTVLTHFSQRYARLPRLNANILHDNNSVGIAFDNMQITMSDLDLLPHMYAPLQLMFAEHCVEMELKAAQRQRQKERRTTSPTAASNRETLIPNRGLCRSPVRQYIMLQPNAIYRETNSSRLRQEIKGMPISGMVLSSRSRSSVCKQRNVTSPQSRSSSTASANQKPGAPSPRSSAISNKLVTHPNGPPSSNTSRRDSPTLSRRVSGNVSLSHSPEGVSRTSSSSRWSGNQVQERLKLALEKTANEPKQQSKDIKGKENRLNSNKESQETPTRGPNVTTGFVVDGNSGYGKPLVTPINKKFTRRELPVSTGVKERSRPHLAFGSRAPVKKHIANADSKSSSVSGSPSPPASKCQWGKLPTNGTGFADKLRGSSPGPNTRESTKMVMNTSYTPKPSKNFDKLNNKSPQRCNKPLNNPLEYHQRPPSRGSSASDITRKFQHDVINNPVSKQETSQITPFDIKKTNVKRWSAKANIILPKARNCKDNTRVTSRTPSTATVHNITKSFKPQLEDIESSYLLLNKGAALEDKTKSNASNVTLTLKHKPFDENLRKQQLESIKEKFKSRAFREDARYEKIEGLNWISWK